MIECLFSSSALYATLAMFFDFPSDWLFPRLISRRTGVSMKSVLRELRKLEKIGVIRGMRYGRSRSYWLNEDFPLHEELMSLFGKTRGSRRYPSQTPPEFVLPESALPDDSDREGYGGQGEGRK